MAYTGTGYDISDVSKSSAIQDQRFGTLPIVFPEDLQFEETKRGMNIQRIPEKIKSQTTINMSNSNNEIIVRMPNENGDIFDARQGYITFDVQIQVTGGTYVRLSNGIWTSFIRFISRTANNEMENIQEYGRLYSWLWEALNDDREKETFNVFFGIGTPTEREAFSKQKFRYTMPLISGFFGTEVLPLGCMSGYVEFSLFIGDIGTFIETDGTDPVITFTNVIFHVKRIAGSPQYIHSVKNKIYSKGMSISFPTYNFFSQQVSAGSVGLNTLTVNSKFASIKTIIFFWVKQSDITNPLADDKFRTWPRLTNQHQWRINNRLFPPEAVQYFDPQRTEAYFAYADYCRKWNLMGNFSKGTPVPISPDEYANGNQFFIVADLDQYPYQQNVINPFSNELSALNLQLDAYIEFPLASTFNGIFFLEYQRQINILPNGTVIITY